MLGVPALPGLVWLWMFYRTDRYQPEPRHLVAITFLLGALATLPAIGLEMLAAQLYPFLRHVAHAMVAAMVGLAALLHGAYDLCALLPATRPLVIVLVGLLFALVARQIQLLSADSPFRPPSKLTPIRRFATLVPAIAVAPARTMPSLA